MKITLEFSDTWIVLARKALRNVNKMRCNQKLAVLSMETWLKNLILIQSANEIANAEALQDDAETERG